MKNAIIILIIILITLGGLALWINTYKKMTIMKNGTIIPGNQTKTEDAESSKQDNSSSVAGWNTYTDKDGIYTIKYPIGWLYGDIKIYGSGGICFGDNQGLYNLESEDDVCGIQISIIDKNKLNLDLYEKIQQKQGSMVNKININGINALSVESKQGSRYLILYNDKREKYVSVSFIALEGEENKIKLYRENFDMMVNTIKLN